MSNIYKIAIIGCGGIANGKHMPSLKKLDNVQMVAFCDIIPERAEEAKAKYGMEDAKVYSDYKELLKDGSIDIVHVCTPNDSHAEITIAALESGKHVMSEKPMAKTAVDARRMVEAAKRTGKKLTVGYNNRFRSDSQYLKQLCEDGTLGDIYYAKAHALRRRAVPTWGVFLDEEKQGGGPLIDIGTHALDLTLWMMNNYEPKIVLGSSFHKLGSRPNAANAWGSWDPEKFKVEDSAFGMIVMKNGATIVLESSWALNVAQSGEAKCTLCGTEAGADMWNGLNINGEKYGRLYDQKIELTAGGVDFYDGEAENAPDLEMRLWIEAIEQDKEPVVTPEQACVVSEILEAIYESSRTGKAIYFD
ncbi:Gfo/Idh/MocA family oxidoreductase [Paenibacillus thiaminolyticus]|uniref:Gfo/Idh/MocA family oxidoreductase n=1 Tax=Paenibacillus thiaminolyticus TaxID=49283 RepID=A0AAP9DXM6_PANTH|nr:Gfo/Idh/MocA family oxidoreductase [Paenibacillus thiaminolyticus]MCY9537255.1 Gfo/Idh/MocA family oxidoreductase [Paenibacillus thiaminolyticus]MCY9600064.1 Gfo/Idh/MocA family oxidoreductase [Paenibacillus thiaminolyticus]MCY9610523.1 Gfo/Idh/MocA family oxidoreductase [Paenibacillus thiaminolyticus]MCY9615896.1 Gfo/Idh/MocA family oxidoreductase [Paenibacillus thiaminolyticus]MCY9617117.1 Gfo/Idh/MocA family oxidoreductase [Paenibacillus thiaminolyticus]